MQKLALLLVLALFANLSHANLITHDFENNSLYDWEVTNETLVSTSNPGFESLYGVNFDASNFGSNEDITSLESFFNLSSGSFTSQSFCVTYNCISGQAMTRTVTVEAGDTFEFEWFSKLANGDLGLADMLVANGAPIDVVDSIFFVAENEVHFITDGLGLPGIVQNANTSHIKQSYEFQNAGVFNIGFGVMNGGFDGINGLLQVDNVVFTDRAEVPEPGTLALFALALLALNLLRK